MSRAESDEGLEQACVVRDQAVTNSLVGIVAGHVRFMQQGHVEQVTSGTREPSPRNGPGQPRTRKLDHRHAVANAAYRVHAGAEPRHQIEDETLRVPLIRLDLALSQDPSERTSRLTPSLHR